MIAALAASTAFLTSSRTLVCPYRLVQTCTPVGGTIAISLKRPEGEHPCPFWDVPLSSVVTQQSRPRPVPSLAADDRDGAGSGR